jgi:hypothetical protein
MNNSKTIKSALLTTAAAPSSLIGAEDERSIGHLFIKLFAAAFIVVTLLVAHSIKAEAPHIIELHGINAETYIEINNNRVQTILIVLAILSPALLMMLTIKKSN